MTTHILTASCVYCFCSVCKYAARVQAVFKVLVLEHWHAGCSVPSGRRMTPGCWFDTVSWVTPFLFGCGPGQGRMHHG